MPSYYVDKDLKSNNLSLNKAADVAQNCPLWRLMSTFGTSGAWWKKKNNKTTCRVATLQL